MVFDVAFKAGYRQLHCVEGEGKVVGLVGEGLSKGVFDAGKA